MYNQVTNQVALDEQKDCTLVGYKKINPTTTESIVELGTLKPQPLGPEFDLEGISSLYGAVSMPTLLGGGHLHLINSGSLPDLSTNVTTGPSNVVVQRMMSEGGIRDSATSSDPAQVSRRLDTLLSESEPKGEDHTETKPEMTDSALPAEDMMLEDVITSEESKTISPASPDSCHSDSVSDDTSGPIANGYIASSSGSGSRASLSPVPDDTEPSLTTEETQPAASTEQKVEESSTVLTDAITEALRDSGISTKASEPVSDTTKVDTADDNRTEDTEDKMESNSRSNSPDRSSIGTADSGIKLQSESLDSTKSDTKEDPSSSAITESDQSQPSSELAKSKPTTMRNKRTSDETKRYSSPPSLDSSGYMTSEVSVLELLKEEQDRMNSVEGNSDSALDLNPSVMSRTSAGRVSIGRRKVKGMDSPKHQYSPAGKGRTKLGVAAMHSSPALQSMKSETPQHGRPLGRVNSLNLHASSSLPELTMLDSYRHGKPVQDKHIR